MGFPKKICIQKIWHPPDDAEQAALLLGFAHLDLLLQQSPALLIALLQRPQLLAQLLDLLVKLVGHQKGLLALGDDFAAAKLAKIKNK